MRSPLLCFLTGLAFWRVLMPLGFAPKLLVSRSVKTSGASRPPLTTLFSSAVQDKSQTSYAPVFDFQDAAKNATDKFERIDDVIMGGISKSALRQLPDEDFARWSGICRIDGGGFCGTRTLPFVEPLQVDDWDGIYMTCRLSSDDEPDRRVWKITTRSNDARGEQLYQASYLMPRIGDKDDWGHVLVPFEDFRLVRGPRMVPDAPPINVTGGLFQIGLSMSKFQIAQNTTELPNFRPGFFEVQIRDIGLYRNESSLPTVAEAVASPTSLPSKEAKRKIPLIARILFSIIRTFFNEKTQRRKSAMRILREKRGYSRMGAILYGIKVRSKARGAFLSFLQTCRILARDSFVATAGLMLRLAIVSPIVAIRKVVRAFFGDNTKTIKIEAE